MDRKILVLENSTMVAELIGSPAFQQTSGWKFILESDQNLFVQTAFSEQPDLILLSNQDAASGYSCIEALRQDNRTQSTPILLLTSARDQLDEASLSKLGVSGFVRKPFEYKTLKSQIDEVLASSPGRSSEELDQLEMVDDELIGLLTEQQNHQSEPLQVVGIESVNMDVLSEELDPTQHWVEATPVELDPLEGESPAALSDGDLGWSEEPINGHLPHSTTAEPVFADHEPQSDGLVEGDEESSQGEAPPLLEPEDSIEDLNFSDDADDADDALLSESDEDEGFSFDEFDDELSGFDELDAPSETPATAKVFTELKLEVRGDHRADPGILNQPAYLSKTGVTVLECVPFGGHVGTDEIEEIDQIQDESLGMDFLAGDGEGFEHPADIDDGLLDTDDIDLYELDEELGDASEGTSDLPDTGEFDDDDDFEDDWEDSGESVEMFSDPSGSEGDSDLAGEFSDLDDIEAFHDPEIAHDESEVGLDFNGDVDDDFDLDEHLSLPVFDGTSSLDSEPTPSPVTVSGDEGTDDTLDDDLDESGSQHDLEDSVDFDEPELLDDPEVLGEFDGPESDFGDSTGLVEGDLELEDQGDFGEPESLDDSEALDDFVDPEDLFEDETELEDQGDFGEPESLGDAEAIDDLENPADLFENESELEDQDDFLDPAAANLDPDDLLEDESELALDDEGDFGEPSSLDVSEDASPEDLLEDESEFNLEGQGDLGEAEDLFEDEFEPEVLSFEAEESSDPPELEEQDVDAELSFENPPDSIFSDPEGVEALAEEMEHEEADAGVPLSGELVGVQETDLQVDAGEEITFISQGSVEDPEFDPVVAQEPLSIEIEFESLPPLGEDEASLPLAYSEEEALPQQDVGSGDEGQPEDDDGELDDWLGEGVDNAAGNLQQMINLRQVTAAKFDLDVQPDDSLDEEFSDEDLSLDSDEAEGLELEDGAASDDDLSLDSEDSEPSVEPAQSESLSMAYEVEAIAPPVAENPLGSMNVGYQTVSSDLAVDDAELQAFDESGEVMFEVSPDVFGMDDFNMESIGSDDPALEATPPAQAPVEAVVVEAPTAPVESVSNDPFERLSGEQALTDEPTALEGVQDDLATTASALDSSDPFERLSAEQTPTGEADEPVALEGEQDDLSATASTELDSAVNDDTELDGTSFMGGLDDFDGFIDESNMLGETDKSEDSPSPVIDESDQEESDETAGFDPALMAEDDLESDETAGFDPALMAEDDLEADETAGFDPALMAEDDLESDETAGFDPALMAEDDSESDETAGFDPALMAEDDLESDETAGFDPALMAEDDLESDETAGFDPALMAEDDLESDETAGFDPALMAEDDLESDETAGFDPALMAEDDLESDETAGFDPALMAEDDLESDETAGFDPVLMAEDDLESDETAGFDPALMAEDDLESDETAGFDPSLKEDPVPETAVIKAVAPTTGSTLNLNVSEDFQDKLGGMIEAMVQDTIRQTLDDLLPQMMQQIVKEELEND